MLLWVDEAFALVAASSDAPTATLASSGSADEDVAVVVAAAVVAAADALAAMDEDMLRTYASSERFTWSIVFATPKVLSGGRRSLRNSAFSEAQNGTVAGRLADESLLLLLLLFWWLLLMLLLTPASLRSRSRPRAGIQPVLFAVAPVPDDGIIAQSCASEGKGGKGAKWQ